MKTIEREKLRTKTTSSKVLTFKIKDEVYCLDILKVRDIVGLPEITAVPATAAHVLGVINLRGRILPVLDLGMKFGLPALAASRDSCVITALVKNPSSGDEVMLGLAVDAVLEVMEISDEDVDAVPALDDVRVDFVKGLITTDERVCILLDIDKTIQNQDLKALGTLLGQAEKKEAATI